MTTLLNSKPTINHQGPIKLKVIGVASSDLGKLQKIIQLSETRQRRYQMIESGSLQTADMIIIGDPSISLSEQDKKLPHVTLVSSAMPASAGYIIQLPMMGFRVLRVLDEVIIVPAPSTKAENVTEVIEQQQKLVIAPAPEVSESLDNHEEQSAYKILIVDDSVLIHKALEIELSKASFNSQLTYTESGEECLEQIAKGKFDIIFLDVMMPGIDGYETCTQIRKNTLFKKTPVIMLSAKASPLDEVKGVMAGCTTYLTKPIKHEDFQKLLVRMDKWLEKFKQA